MRNVAAALVVGAALWLAAGLAAPAAAQDVGQAVEAGKALLERGDQESALYSFEAATQIDPLDAEAWFFRGLTNNRLGAHADAFIDLQTAEALGVSGAGLDFEVGWAALGIGAYDEAIARLDRVRGTPLDSAKVTELLGRAQLGKGELDRAETLLMDAMEQDSSLVPTAAYHLAQVEQARGNEAGAKSYLDAILDRSPGSPVAADIRQIVAETVPPPGPQRRPWRVGASFSYGSNSNPLAVPSSLALPRNLSGKRSDFMTISAIGSYDFRLSDRDVVQPGYEISYVDFLDIGDMDRVSHLFFANYGHRLFSDVEVGAQLRYNFVDVDGAEFSDFVAFRPRAIYRPVNWARLELAYQYALIGFDQAVNPVMDRDSRNHVISAQGSADVNGMPWPTTLRLGYAHTWNDADGGDFDYGSDAVSGGFIVQAPFDITLDLGVDHVVTRYTQLNSLASNSAGTALFQFSRRDAYTVWGGRATKEIIAGLDVFADFREVTNSSNIPVYGFDQTIWSAGLNARF